LAEEQPAFGLDRAQLRASFERASGSYDSAARLQLIVGAELLDRLAPFDFDPSVVLDLGCGTGRISAELSARYPRARVIAVDLAPGMLREALHHQLPGRPFERVCGDALRLPLAAASVDLVFSNLMLQWCDPLDTALAEVRRILKGTGFFAFSTFGPDTLHELRVSWAQADGYNHVNHFADVHVVGDAVTRCGLTEPVLDIDRHEVDYPDAVTLMRDLKAIGAHNVTAGRPRSLLGRARLERVQQAYESFRRDGQLPATYEIIYGASWGASGRAAAAVIGGVAHIPPGSIRRGRP
jgi:malonyl-CoA O-methyltransferase